MKNISFETEKQVANLLGKKSYWERFWDPTVKVKIKETNVIIG